MSERKSDARADTLSRAGVFVLMVAVCSLAAFSVHQYVKLQEVKTDLKEIIQSMHQKHGDTYQQYKVAKIWYF